MTRPVRAAAAALLLAGPTAIAFFSGGYMNLSSLVQANSLYAGLAGGVIACVLVAAAAAIAPTALPCSRSGRVAVAGIVGLAAWVGISIAWAPLSTPATQDLQRLILYAAAFVAGCAFLRGRAVARRVEPALAAGALVVICYGLSGRVLPGIIHLQANQSAGGRLEQPLTYYNAMGALAAIGFVLSVRLAGDRTRSRALTTAAAAAAVPLGLGAGTTFSRGALAALAAGLVALAFLAPTRAQLRSIALALATAVPAVVATLALDGFRTLQGSQTSREHQGLGMLALVAVLVAAAVGGHRLLLRAEARSRLRPDALRLPRWAPLAGIGAIVAIAALVLALAYKDPHKTGSPNEGASASRLSSIQSNRYAYWRVAIDGFRAHPLRGVGSGGFRSDWLQKRTITEAAQDAHSLYIETLSELGLVGLLLLGLLYGGVAVSARRLHGADPLLAAGPVAALTVYVLHSGIDWDWEMPAVTLVALALAATVVAGADAPPYEEGAAGAEVESRTPTAETAAATATPASTTMGISAASRKRVSP